MHYPIKGRINCDLFYVQIKIVRVVHMALQNAIECISRLASHTFKIEINWTSGINSNSTVFFLIPITN